MTEYLILERWSDHPEHGTLGELYYEGEKIAETIERPWVDNQPFISCVPCGTYELVPFVRSNGDHVYALYNPDLNVYVDADERPNDHGRFSILIHVANWAKELAGCIAPGLKLAIGKYHGSPKYPETLMVYQSAKACEKLFKLIKSKQIEYIMIIEKRKK